MAGAGGASGTEVQRWGRPAGVAADGALRRLEFGVEPTFSRVRDVVPENRTVVCLQGVWGRGRLAIANRRATG